VAGFFAALEKRVMTFVGAVLDVPPQGHADKLERAVPQTEGRRKLPFDLYLTRGLESSILFPKGPIDEFRFFQREDVSSKHDVEFVTRLDPTDTGSENYQAFGVFKLRNGDSKPLPKHRANEVVTRVLGHGPAVEARTMLEKGPGPCRIVGATTKAWGRHDGRRVSWHDVLEVLRTELTPEERIAWIEEAFAPNETNTPVHRYYVDAKRQTYLVRDVKGEKRLYVAETSPEALLASASYLRRRTEATTASATA
jgi:hypothetical protein